MDSTLSKRTNSALERLAAYGSRASLLEAKLADFDEKLISHRRDARYWEMAHTLVQQVAKDTQAQVQYQVSELVNLALASVFEDPYTFELDLSTKRGRTEASFFFVKNGARIPPDHVGGGVIDVAAFALKLLFYSFRRNDLRNVLILDEPLKWLKGSDMPEKGAEMIRQLAQQLNMQIIMVSHSPELIHTADNIIEVSAGPKVSQRSGHSGSVLPG